MQELTAGTLRGHYRIVRRLGQGGMGVVYQAEDQKLGRLVAIKLLPEATRQDPAALERFWREARTASSLNHAGICTIYELNESGDQPFIAMELLAGESLDKLHYRQSMPYPRLLDFGTDPTHQTQTGFAWSPSATRLAILQLQKSPDVVMIADPAGEQQH